jgi:hypothetical protein
VCCDVCVHHLEEWNHRLGVCQIAVQYCLLLFAQQQMICVELHKPCGSLQSWRGRCGVLTRSTPMELPMLVPLRALHSALTIAAMLLR